MKSETFSTLTPSMIVRLCGWLVLQQYLADKDVVASLSMLHFAHLACLGVHEGRAILCWR
jgi:hypothetical protein